MFKTTVRPGRYLEMPVLSRKPEPPLSVYFLFSPFSPEQNTHTTTWSIPRKNYYSDEVGNSTDGSAAAATARRSPGPGPPHLCTGSPSAPAGHVTCPSSDPSGPGRISPSRGCPERRACCVVQSPRKAFHIVVRGGVKEERGGRMGFGVREAHCV